MHDDISKSTRVGVVWQYTPSLAGGVWWRCVACRYVNMSCGEGERNQRTGSEQSRMRDSGEFEVLREIHGATAMPGIEVPGVFFRREAPRPPRHAPAAFGALYSFVIRQERRPPFHPPLSCYEISAALYEKGHAKCKKSNEGACAEPRESQQLTTVSTTGRYGYSVATVVVL